MGFTFGPLSSTALIGVDERDVGVASAVLNSAQQVGGSFGTALLNTFATTSAAHYLTSHATGLPSLAVRATAVTHGYTTVFWVSGALLFVAASTTAVLVKARRGHPAEAA
jgi:hypothetical protein